MSEQLHSINEVLQDLKAGKPVIIVDDESRENEGDLIIAAEFATQENINFMVKYAYAPRSVRKTWHSCNGYQKY